MQHPARRRILIGTSPLVAALIALALAACQEPAGLPPTLERGVVSFQWAGPTTGTFVADGRCYWATGYPPADSACAVALDLGDTIRIRGERAPREAAWQHMNLAFPESGDCADPGACRIAIDYLSPVGKVERSFRSTEADVTILEQTEDRMRGTFTGRVLEIEGLITDTITILDGTFDVPVER